MAPWTLALQNFAYSTSDAINTFISIHIVHVTSELGVKVEKLNYFNTQSWHLLRVRYKTAVANLEFTYAEIQHFGWNMLQYKNDNLTIHWYNIHAMQDYYTKTWLNQILPLLFIYCTLNMRSCIMYEVITAYTSILRYDDSSPWGKALGQVLRRVHKCNLRNVFSKLI